MTRRTHPPGLVAAAASILAAACSQVTAPDVSPEKIVGTWRSADGAELRFTADSQCDVQRIPASLVTIRKDGVLSGKCTWEIGGESGRHRVVDVHVQRWEDGSNGANIPVLIETSGGPMRLFLDLGDPDSGERYEFRR